MNTTHDDNATTWRDVADQLTPAQVERLTGMEQRSALPADETAAALLEGAREWARSNLTGRVMFGHLPTPSGARRVFHWQQDDDSGRWSRRFEGTARGLLGVEADIVGIQHSDGTIKRSIYVNAHAAELHAAAARDLAAALIEALNELDELDRFDAIARGEDGDPVRCFHEADDETD
jgi:hypothetical protein